MMSNLKLEVGKTYVDGNTYKVSITSKATFDPPNKSDLYLGSNGELYYRNGHRFHFQNSGNDLIKEENK